MVYSQSERLWFVWPNLDSNEICRGAEKALKIFKKMCFSQTLRQVWWVQGCTKTYQDTLANNHYQWIRGKVFGMVFIDNNWKIFHLWPAMEWSSGCVTASRDGAYRVNINGQTLLQSDNIASNIFKSSRASFHVKTKTIIFIGLCKTSFYKDNPHRTLFWWTQWKWCLTTEP